MRVLFICVANSGRSVMAERMFNELAVGRHIAESAGSDPGAAAHPTVVEVLCELGIPAGDHVPRRLESALVAKADVVVSTCGEEACPVTPPGTRRVYWDLPDPKNEPLDRVRAIRDEIRTRVEQLIEQLDGEAA
jgi:arsenate reductase